MDLTNSLKDYVKREGADLVGVTPAERLDKAPAGHRPRDFFENAKNVVVMATRMLNCVLDQMPKSRHEYTCNYYHANQLLDLLAFKTGQFLERRGFQAYPISIGINYGMALSEENVKNLMGLFSFKHAAVAAGLGQFGLNGLLLTPQYGPRVRLISVITNAPLEADKPFEGPQPCQPEKCGKRCIALCPEKELAFKDEKLNKFACWEATRYLPKDPSQPKQGSFWYQKAGRCGMCVAACPPELFKS